MGWLIESLNLDCTIHYCLDMVYVFLLGITLLISILWVKGIDNMKKNHPDYKGDDFLGGL